jgi:hypothetical protein
MTRDEIVRMAREVYGDWFPNVPIPSELERFVALVAAAEREAMKSDGWRQCAVGQRTTQYCGQLEAAVAAEREAWFAAAIRSRGETK